MGNKNDERLVNDFLKNNYIISENKTQLYTTLIPIIFSKKVFKKGSELQSFLKDELGIEFANYVFKSRTILAGKINKYINDLSIEDSVSLNRLVIEKISAIIDNDDLDISAISNSNEKSTSKSLFSMWAEHIESKE